MLRKVKNLVYIHVVCYIHNNKKYTKALLSNYKALFLCFIMCIEKI